MAAAQDSGLITERSDDQTKFLFSFAGCKNRKATSAKRRLSIPLFICPEFFVSNGKQHLYAHKLP